ncbi:MAG: sigma-54 interaction domain-containing protein [Phycisphaerales bacterium JB038]
MHPGLATSDARRPDPAAGPREALDAAFSAILGRSPAIDEARALARRIAGRAARSVLVVGETGTGKELFARGIHAGSAIADAPFVPVNCPALPATLLEAELFGYERGAFTGARDRKRGLLEVAGEGTLFLDEVSSLPIDLQPKLLRALESRRIRRVGGLSEIEIGCRIVAATNESLADAVAEGRFREDLYYRLNVFEVRIPPLRDRRGDVTVLARHFVDEAVRNQAVAPRRLSEAALQELEAHAWPGNVRELKNVVDRAVVFADEGVILPEHLSFRRRDRETGLGGGDPTGREAALRADGSAVIRIPPDGRTLASIEAEAVARILDLTGWNKSAAAEILAISRPTLLRKVRAYDLTPSDDV